MKICVADDELEVRRSIIKKIDGIDPSFSIEDAGYGIAALAAMQQFKPDVAFLDIRMPGVDGLELLARLKQASPWIRVVMLSGYHEFEYARRALQLGADDFLLKPASKKQLGDTLVKIKGELEAGFLSGLEPYLQQLKEAGLELEEIRCGQINLWQRTDLSKAIVFAPLPEEPDKEAADGTLFSGMVNKRAWVRVSEAEAGHFTIPSQFVHAFRREWGKWLARQANSGMHWVDAAVRYIEQSADSQLTLEAVAQKVGVHAVTLSRVFKKHTGLNFVHYMTRHRMRQAKELLLNTGQTIQEISEKVGYTDPAYFREQFKKEFGQSPRELRQK